MKVLRANGETENFSPTKEKVWEEAQRIIKAKLLQIVDLRDGNVMLVDEEGLYTDKPTNSKATSLAHGKVNIDPTRGIVGDVAIVSKKALM